MTMVASMVPNISFHSAKGLNRNENQDRCIVAKRGAVISDGIGGACAGGLMAETTTWAIGELLKSGVTNTHEVLGIADRAVNLAKEYVSIIGKAVGKSMQTKGAGCMLGVITFPEVGGFQIGIKGDIGAYLVKEEETVRMSKVCGLFEPVPYVGDNGEKWTYIEATPKVASGAKILLMTDGIWRYVSETEMTSVCNEVHTNENAIARGLVEIASAHASPDDKTALVIGF